MCLRLRLLTTCLVLTFSLPPSSASQPYLDGAPPRDIVNYLFRVRMPMPEPRDVEHLYERIRREPEVFAPLVAETLVLPERLEDWKPFPKERPKDGESNPGGVFYHRLMQWLGREHADPILVRYFSEAYNLHAQSVREYERIDALDKTEIDAETKAIRLAELSRLRQMAMYIMSGCIGEASQLRSPALVDGMLKFWEAGYVDYKRHLPRYPLMFAHERDDVIPRLKALMNNPRTAEHVRLEIREALKHYAASLAAAETENPAVAQAEPTPKESTTLPESPR